MIDDDKIMNDLDYIDIGYYVYSIYENLIGNEITRNEISGDIRLFYYILGWHIIQNL